MRLFACCLMLSVLFRVPAVAAAPGAWEGLTFHAPPVARKGDAKSSEWPRFLGAADAPVSKETGLRHDFPPGGPAVVWECRKGSGYASPAIAGGRLVLFHRVGEAETLDCLDPETGKRFWRYSYPAAYSDDFGYSDGPRAGPVIHGGKVYTFGVTGWLKCVDLQTGERVWEVDCEKRFSLPKYFFGCGTSPLIVNDLVLVNAGGGGGECVIAFDRNAGTVKWILNHPWGQSYASPIVTQWHGTQRVLVFAGGKSNPATGGLLVVDPVAGSLESSFPWRAQRYPSVNAATPILCGTDQVLISQAYMDRDHDQNGSVMLRTDAKGQLSAVWKNRDLGCHWMTPVHHDGHIYAFSGEKERSCALVCHEADTGNQVWSEKFTWEYTAANGQTIPMGLYRASLLHVDGRFLCLGEWGTLSWLDLSPAGAKMAASSQLFTAQQSWTLPALSNGLLYVLQNEDDRITGTPSRLICYDLRATP